MSTINETNYNFLKEIKKSGEFLKLGIGQAKLEKLIIQYDYIFKINPSKHLKNMIEQETIKLQDKLIKDISNMARLKLINTKIYNRERFLKDIFEGIGDIDDFLAFSERYSDLTNSIIKLFLYKKFILENKTLYHLERGCNNIQIPIIRYLEKEQHTYALCGEKTSLSHTRPQQILRRLLRQARHPNSDISLLYKFFLILKNNNFSNSDNNLILKIKIFSLFKILKESGFYETKLKTPEEEFDRIRWDYQMTKLQSKIN